MGVATGSADDPQQAIEMAYAAVGKLAMTGLFYRPKFDFVSRDYFASIMNRLDFLQSSELL